MLARELRRRVRTWFLDSRGKPANAAAFKIGGELQDILTSPSGPFLKVACKSLRAGQTKVVRIEGATHNENASSQRFRPAGCSVSHGHPAHAGHRPDHRCGVPGSCIISRIRRCASAASSAVATG